MHHAEAIVFLNDVRDTLASQSDLSPSNPHVNTCLKRFVATLQAWQRSGFGHDLADDPDFAGLACDLPALCGKAECEMEKWWCRKILASQCPGAQALAAFWYLDNYEALCEAELQLLGDACGERFAFLGSGALPLTAIVLARSAPDLRITCVDCDEEACELAFRLVRVLGLDGRVEIEMGAAEDYAADCEETIICASLLRAPGLFDRLGAMGINRLIVRDAEGPYRFCYRPGRIARRRLCRAGQERARARTGSTPAGISSSGPDRRR